ncbi:MAG TPA: TetR/AcrR family transcriptional regulator, partial [Lachnospiraceae bacterium]|nr:TetR/AcrR family transcriptional regulator [Lachnospiraceae bacterium]
MNTIVTSREEILKASRKLAMEKGWKAVSIRSVAAACGVSVGSIYYYFPSKTALLTDTVESVWYEIFHEPGDPSVFENTERCVRWVYARMEAGSREYPEFFTLHSLGFMQEKKAGKTEEAAG